MYNVNKCSLEAAKDVTVSTVGLPITGHRKFKH